MQTYVFAYHGAPNNLTPEEGMAYKSRWMEWMDGLGDAVLNRGHALGKSKTASKNGVADNGGSNPLAGYTLVQAADIDTAMKMALASPHVEIGGTIEVAPVLDMAM